MDSVDSKDIVTVKAKPGTWDIFAYKMYHTFVCVAGVVRLIFSAIFLALGIGTAGHTDWYLTLIVIAIGALNVVVTPLLFLFQSVKAAGNSKAVTYTFSQDKIVANDGKNRVDMEWMGLALIVWMRKEMLIYTSPTQALVLPRRQMEGKDADVLRIIEAAANPDRTVKRKLL